jgi:CubicO group peptidase (beta-lactamase class C family)
MCPGEGEVASARFVRASSTGWPVARANAVGVRDDRLVDLIQFAIDHESSPDRSEDPAAAKAETLRRVLGPNADTEIVGPFTPPGRVNGIVIRRGHVLAEFGDTDYVDEIASATKSFLSLLCGVAVTDGIIRDIDASVYDDTLLDLLGSAHNRMITWRHLLRQTSEWDGVLFDKRPVGHRGDRVGDPLREPGMFWEYNDVRVNLLARCLLEMFRRPLPDVLHDRIMEPIGASSLWSWHGYENSWITIDGRRMQSVSGGAHWGGGIWMNARDLSLIGVLYLNEGRCGDQQLISEDWIRETRTSCDLNYMYGLMWWLQHDEGGRQISFAVQGGGSHHCFVIPDHELVIVVKWIEDDAWKEFLDHALRLAVDRPALGPVHYDFTCINHSQT